MNAVTLACAPSGVTWHGINWVDVHPQVRGLQARIVKATQDGSHNKAKVLQWLLTHSFSGKALAVKRVTENRGKNIPCVDQALWTGGKDPRNSIDEATTIVTQGGHQEHRLGCSSSGEETEGGTGRCQQPSDAPSQLP